MRMLKAHLPCKSNAQRVTEVSLFEGTTSRSRVVVNEFHNIVLARVVSQFPAQYFGKLPGFNL